MNLQSFLFLLFINSVCFATQILNVKIIGNKNTRNEIILREINHPYPAEFDSSMAKEDRNRIKITKNTEAEYIIDNYINWHGKYKKKRHLIPEGFKINKNIVISGMKISTIYRNIKK